MTEASDRVSISAAKQLNIRATFTTGAFKQHLIDFLGLKDLSKTNWSRLIRAQALQVVLCHSFYSPRARTPFLKSSEIKWQTLKLFYSDSATPVLGASRYRAR